MKKNIVQISKNAARSLSLIHMNLTKNTCHSIHRDLSVNRPAVLDKGLDGFFSSVVNNIAKDDIKAEFISRFSPSILKADFESGLFMDEMRIPIRLVDQRVIWCHQTVNISRNPSTGDLEAVMSLYEDDKDIRLAEHYKRLIQEAYEFVGSIDVETGLLTVISEPNDRGLTNVENRAVPYMENLVSRMNTLVDSECVSACIEALSLNTVCEKMKEQDTYTCIFPAKASLLGYNGAFQWSFHCVDGSKTEILFSRREIKRLSC